MASERERTQTNRESPRCSHAPVAALPSPHTLPHPRGNRGEAKREADAALRAGLDEARAELQVCCVG